MSRLPEEYPDAPGFKANGPSEQAAERIAPTAKVIRAKVLQHYISRFPDGLTADEVAIDLDLSVLTVRPRVSELHRDARIEDTGLRRRNQSGMTATVWRYVREPGPMEKS